MQLCRYFMRIYLEDPQIRPFFRQSLWDAYFELIVQYLDWQPCRLVLHDVLLYFPKSEDFGYVSRPSPSCTGGIEHFSTILLVD